MHKAVGESRGGEMSSRCSSMCALPLLLLLSCPPGPCPFSEQVLASGRCCQPERAVSKQRWGGRDDKGAQATARQRLHLEGASRSLEQTPVCGRRLRKDR